MTHLNRYHAAINGVGPNSLGTCTFAADTIDEALDEATVWALNGCYDQSGTVDVTVWSADHEGVLPGDAAEMATRPVAVEADANADLYNAARTLFGCCAS